MKFIGYFSGLSLFILLVPGLILAATSEFTILAQIGTDTQAPTTPTLLSVTPIAPTQIDVTWSAATDDVLVAGYRVFKDAVQIATTTLLSYSDTGLTPSTTYAYTVDAFDSFGNISSTSNSLSTTTPPLPPVATSTPTTTTTNASGGSTRISTNLVDLLIETTQTSALFTWQTVGQTQYTLIWGRTQSYELGSVSGIVFSQNHVTNITQLEPGTTYYYELRVTDVRGVTKVVSADRFVTQSAFTAGGLPNVLGFRAQADANDVVLSWQNTFSNPEYYVRIVRSHLFYPSNIQDGAVVYEGTGESFVDRDALSQRSPQYYTIFVRNNTGGVSSGAIARAFTVVRLPGEIPLDTQPTSTIPADIGDDTILRAVDITIVQNELRQIFDVELTLDKNIPYIISIPYDAVAKNLKSIIVSVQNPTNQKELSAYLLKLNQAGDAYTALIPGPAVVGTAGIMVEVFDYEQATVRRISTTISFIDTTPLVPFFPDRLMMYLTYLLMFCLFVWSILLLFLLRRRRRSKETS